MPLSYVCDLKGAARTRPSLKAVGLAAVAAQPRGQGAPQGGWAEPGEPPAAGAAGGAGGAVDEDGVATVVDEELFALSGGM